MKRNLFGLSEDVANADREAGSARIGGPYHPGWHLDSYYRSTQVLIEHAVEHGQLEQLATACVHMQRHTVELLIKSLIDNLHSVACLAEEAESGRQSVRPHPLAEPNHDLPGTVQVLREQLELYGAPMPTDLAELALAIAEVEDGDETRWRYARGKSARLKKGKPRPTPKRYENASFPDELVLPIVAWQKRLEAIWSDVFRERPTGSDEPLGLVGDLYYEAQAYYQSSTYEDLEQWEGKCPDCRAEETFWAEPGWNGDRCAHCGSRNVALKRLS